MKNGCQFSGQASHFLRSLQKQNMDLLERIDSLIEKYKKEHRGEAPLYLVVSPDESAAVREEIRKRENAPDIAVISTYKDVRIAEHPAMLDGKMYVSNELPETGS